MVHLIHISFNPSMKLIFVPKIKQVEMGGCKGPITTFIVEPFVPHNDEFYLNIVSERLGCSISFSECGGIDIEENWDKVLLIISLLFFSYLVYYKSPLNLN